MANQLSKIELPNNTTYDIKDATLQAGDGITITDETSGKRTLAIDISDIILANGTYTGSTINKTTRGNVDITFSDIGTTNYIVLLNPILGDFSCGVQSKTATGFKLFYRNNDSSSRQLTVNWAVIRLP